MSFFKDFKADFSEALNELLPEETAGADEVVDTLAEGETADKVLADLDKDEPKASSSLFANAAKEAEKEAEAEKEEAKKNDFFKNTSKPSVAPIAPAASMAVVDNEVAVITKGMTINGDIISSGPIEICGTVNGNVTSQGKIVASGFIKGDTNAAEFFADNANVQGEIKTDGAVKIGQNSVIKGGVYATSAVIAGAVKGDIDVHGPVVVDTTAIIVGNIKSKSVQINNGAIIEGFCSQCYSDIDMKTLFGE